MKLPTINKYAAGWGLIGFAVARIAWEQDTVNPAGNWQYFDWGGELVTIGLAGLGVFLLLKG
jgi:hypothetical protein